MVSQHHLSLVILESSDFPKSENVSKSTAILGPGSTTCLSGYKCDFKWVEPQPSVVILGIEGALAPEGGPAGHKAVFRSNSLFFHDAVYYPGLQSKRLISVGKLANLGWQPAF